VIVEVVSTHPHRVRLRITAPDGTHIAAERNLDDVRKRYERVRGHVAGWSELRPKAPT
jgi:hypothetical protein